MAPILLLTLVAAGADGANAPAQSARPFATTTDVTRLSAYGGRVVWEVGASSGAPQLLTFAGSRNATLSVAHKQGGPYDVGPGPTGRPVLLTSELSGRRNVLRLLDFRTGRNEAIARFTVRRSQRDAGPAAIWGSRVAYLTTRRRRGQLERIVVVHRWRGRQEADRTIRVPDGDSIDFDGRYAVVDGYIAEFPGENIDAGWTAIWSVDTRAPAAVHEVYRWHTGEEQPFLNWPSLFKREVYYSALNTDFGGIGRHVPGRRREFITAPAGRARDRTYQAITRDRTGFYLESCGSRAHEDEGCELFKTRTDPFRRRR